MECANSRVQRNPFLRTFLTDELLTGWLFNRHEYTTPSPPASRGSERFAVTLPIYETIGELAITGKTTS